MNISTEQRKKILEQNEIIISKLDTTEFLTYHIIRLEADNYFVLLITENMISSNQIYTIYETKTKNIDYLMQCSNAVFVEPNIVQKETAEALQTTFKKIAEIICKRCSIIRKK